MMALILIVDDREVNRELLVALLGAKGHRLREAGDGAVALAAARAEPPDLVITDLLMPTMDGFELVRQFRSDPALARVPVIFYTARYHLQETRELAQIGNIWRLDKPAEPETIVRVVEQALAASAAAPGTPAALPTDFDREHLHLVTDKLARAVDQLETSHMRLVALGDLGRLLSQEHDLPSALELCCRGARQLLAAKYAIVIMLADDRRSIRHLAATGLDEETALGIDRPDLDLAPLRRLLDVGIPLRLRSGGENPDVTGLLPDETRTHCLLFVPTARDGALILVEKLGAEEFSAEDERLAMLLAAHLSLSCENMKLRSAVSRIKRTSATRKR
jgi:CheY-like chemotaxis protein